jgi:hypothetical protein
MLWLWWNSWWVVACLGLHQSVPRRPRVGLTDARRVLVGEEAEVSSSVAATDRPLHSLFAGRLTVVQCELVG